MKRKEETVKNNPGIYRRYEFDGRTQKWIDTGKYRAIRRMTENGLSKKEQGVFNNIEDAKAFRSGVGSKTSSGTTIHKLALDDPDQRYTFGRLLQDWKSLHYLEIEITSQQQYDSRIKHFKPLEKFNVNDINTTAITGLVKHWLSKEYLKPKDRQTFEKELDALKVILNFYRRHKNNAYFVPILPEHCRAADFTKKAKAPVRGLKGEDLGKFLKSLRDNYPHFYPMALIQLGLGLRIGEVVGLWWDDFNLKKKEACIQRNAAWNSETREHFCKKRKNAKVLETVIPEFLVQVLEQLSAERDPKIPYVFHRNGEIIRRQQVSKAYNRTLKKLEIGYVSGTHMLRKTAGTLARKLTRDVYAASKLLDHSSVSITEKYYQEELDEDKHIVAHALNGALTEAMVEKITPHLTTSDEATCPPVSPKIVSRKLMLINSIG